ncbi:MAG: YitT family protein [Blautia sp.]|nr:YitT family protein [Blautia sp.]
MKEKTTEILKKYIQITAASFIYAAGISLFLDPNSLAAGGVTGISIILNRLIHVETGTLYLLLNIPILFLGMWKFGVRFITRTAYAVAMTSFFTNYLSRISPVTDDLLFAAAAGGMRVAAGMAFIFKAGATTGGTDILVKIIRVRHRYLKTGVIFMCSDVVIVTLSGLIFGNLNLAFYALASVVITSWVMDFILYGADEAKLFYIITERPE